MVKYQEVYDALSFHEWRSALELVEIIAKKRNKPKISSVGIYIHLDRLCEEKYAEERNRQLTHSEFENRSGRPKPEYKLTQGGLKNRTEFKKTEVAGIESIVNPLKA